MKIILEVQDEPHINCISFHHPETNSDRERGAPMIEVHMVEWRSNTDDGPVVMHIASTRKKAREWIKANPLEGPFGDEGYYAICRDFVDNPEVLVPGGVQIEQWNNYGCFYSEYPNESNLPSSIRRHERCFRCGNSYRDFRPSVAGDCPDGCTIQPIIEE